MLDSPGFWQLLFAFPKLHDQGGEREHSAIRSRDVNWDFADPSCPSPNGIEGSLSQEAQSEKPCATKILQPVIAAQTHPHSVCFFSFSYVFGHPQVLHEAVIKSSGVFGPLCACCEHIILHFQYCQTREKALIRGLEEF